MGRLQYFYFPGCRLAPRLPEYDRSVRAVMAALGVDLQEADANCCGYPVRHFDFTAAMLCGARVLALSARKGLPLMTPCKCCYGNLKQVQYWMRRDAALRERIAGLLRREELAWSDDVVVRHLLTALTEDVGLGTVAAKVIQPLQGLKTAAHYGCHALRPGDVTQFDHPTAPVIFEQVIAATGATCVQWPLRLECCGHPLWEKNNGLSLALMRRKLADGLEAGAEVLVTACTYCQIQFDQVRRDHPSGRPEQDQLPAVVVSRLLEAAFGLIDAASLRTSPTAVPGQD